MMITLKITPHSEPDEEEATATETSATVEVVAFNDTELYEACFPEYAIKSFSTDDLTKFFNEAKEWLLKHRVKETSAIDIVRIISYTLYMIRRQEENVKT